MTRPCEEGLFRPHRRRQLPCRDLDNGGHRQQLPSQKKDPAEFQPSQACAKSAQIRLAIIPANGGVRLIAHGPRQPPSKSTLQVHGTREDSNARTEPSA